MASTYSSKLRFELIATGEQSGTWGTTTNTNLGTLLEASIAGVAAVVMAADANYTLTANNGVADEARCAVLSVTSSLSLTATRDVICPTSSKVYIIKNGTSGAQSIRIKTAAGTGITIANGETAFVFCDGTNVVNAITMATVRDASFTIQDNADTTKQAQFQLSSITTGTTRTYTLPDVTDTLVTLTASQALTNKTATTQAAGDNSTKLATTAYADGIWTTGDVKTTLKTVADTGWVMMNDGTIGSAASAGTTRANADTSALFTLLWTNTADAQCAVSGGRGGSAAADFAANKTIALPKMLGRALASAGAGSGLTSRALALALGAEDAAVIDHTHAAGTLAAASNGDHQHIYDQGGVAGVGGNGFTGAGVHDPNALTGVAGAHTHTISGSVANSGVSATGQNMQPSAFLNFMVRL